jgi:hypothetical protein
VVALFGAGSTAPAAVNQQLIIEDEHHLLRLSRAEQLRALNEIDSLGVDKIRAVVWWRYMLAHPAQRTAPRSNARLPGSRIYHRGRFAILDSLVRETHRRGIALQLNPAGASAVRRTVLQLPLWGIRPDRSPRVGRFAHFVAALGRRYNGRYVPRGDRRPLPAVTEWSIYNEPNGRTFLSPQWRRVAGETIPWSPVVYRRLYTRAAKALRRNGHRRSRIYFGETASGGRSEAAPLASMAPGVFLRELACLDEGLRPYQGAAAEARGCKGYRRLDTDGLDVHLYSGLNGAAPALLGSDREEVWTPATPERPVLLLEQLAARGRVPPGLPVYNTEAGFQHHPVTRPLLGGEAQARELNLAEYLQFRTPGIASFAQYLLYDDPFWHTGLRFVHGPMKPAYRAFRMPIAVRDAPGGDVWVWGAGLGRRGGGLLEIWRDGLPALTVTPGNGRGYFEVRLPELRPGAVFFLRDTLSGARSRTASKLELGGLFG